MHYVIFAAASTIGHTLAEKLEAAGHTVTRVAKDCEKIQTNYLCDVSDFDAVSAVAKKIHEDHGPFDGVVNCAGSLLLKPAHNTSYEEYMNVIHKNLTSAFSVLRSTVKLMNPDQGGSIVLIGSAAARTGLANHEAIAAAKAGIHGLVLSAAATYASQNIRINAVAPGLTETHLTTKITQHDLSAKASKAMHALGRFGTPSQVAGMIQFLLQPENNWITGQLFGVDGGLGTVAPKIKI